MECLEVLEQEIFSFARRRMTEAALCLGRTEGFRIHFTAKMHTIRYSLRWIKAWNLWVLAYGRLTLHYNSCWCPQMESHEFGSGLLVLVYYPHRPKWGEPCVRAFF